jgi:hypothetical protein
MLLLCVDEQRSTLSESQHAARSASPECCHVVRFGPQHGSCGAHSLLTTVRRRAQVVNELENCLTTVRAAATLHTHGKTSFEWTKEDGEPWTKEDGKTPKFYKLTSISSARLAVFLLVQLCRLTIACALCYGGSYFIAHTIALGDLILNCVALEVRI